MRAYADTSFLVKLLVEESGTRGAIAEYRRLGRPGLFFLPLHSLEVSNAIRQRAFIRRHSSGPAERSAITRERDAALSRLEKLRASGALIESSIDMDDALSRAQALSAKHTERLGCRGFDLLHVALALELESDVFLTGDRVQGQLARAEGLKLSFCGDE
jgi:predicted nucleic acid-binding protein